MKQMKQKLYSCDFEIKAFFMGKSMLLETCFCQPTELFIKLMIVENLNH